MRCWSFFNSFRPFVLVELLVCGNNEKLGVRKREDHPKMGWSIHSLTADHCFPSVPTSESVPLSPLPSFLPSTASLCKLLSLTSHLLIPSRRTTIHGKSCTPVQITLRKTPLSYYFRLELGKHSLHKSITSSFPPPQRAAMYGHLALYHPSICWYLDMACTWP
jgi:hypothetical protein